MLKMLGINKAFNENHVLMDVDFCVKEGEIHALIGENGAGKSTLMNILGGVLPCDSGKITLLGKDVRRHIEMPDYAQITAAVAGHAQTIREHGRGARSIYAYGWLLDIARCMYVLVNRRPATKTAAAQWALDERVCPCPAELSMALMVRRQPELIRDESVLSYAEGLTEAIQSFAALLEKALGNPDI